MCLSFCRRDIPDGFDTPLSSNDRCIESKDIGIPDPSGGSISARPVLTLQGLDAFTLFAGHPSTRSGIHLITTHPFKQCRGRTADFSGNRFNGRPLGMDNLDDAPPPCAQLALVLQGKMFCEVSLRAIPANCSWLYSWLYSLRILPPPNTGRFKVP